MYIGYGIDQIVKFFKRLLCEVCMFNTEEKEDVWHSFCWVYIYEVLLLDSVFFKLPEYDSLLCLNLVLPDS